jgi:hypothetical protein
MAHVVHAKPHAPQKTSFRYLCGHWIGRGYLAVRKIKEQNKLSFGKPIIFVPTPLLTAPTIW